MPKWGMSITEGELVKWLVEEGAGVSAGDAIAEIETEKITGVVEAPTAGILRRKVAQVGETIPVGGLLGVIADSSVSDEEIEAFVGESQASSALEGEGAEADVSAGVEGEPAPVAAGAPAVAAAPVAASVPSGGRVERLTTMRQTIANRLRAGLATTAQLTLTAEADVTALAEELARLTEAWHRRASYTEAAGRACALALRDHPRVGARWTETGLVHFEQIDIGVAVALEDGLIVPVVRRADCKSLEELNLEITDLAERARGGRLEPAETEGACFSVTNLGGYRIDAFTPLLNPPQTAILGLGQARLRPAVVDGAVVARARVVLSLTFDHQVVDGAPAAAFLSDVVALLESPVQLVSAG